ncbi:hypothetical protein TNCV_2568051 [Trichonephila clavipes]|uniref:Uncharacterized protein n=1 Tax=Trichonephila clavipes TaxID=2585209 RepID=A0A8X7BMS3_TRICX|nr:hypothetical protein TNCV_2568051 [Trichonephila clavipes]
MFCVSSPRFMSFPMRSHRCSIGFRPGEFGSPGTMQNPVRLLEARRVTLQPGMLLLNYCFGWALTTMAE